MFINLQGKAFIYDNKSFLVKINYYLVFSNIFIKLSINAKYRIESQITSAFP